jgi:phenylalanyl-tRNA synthetase beta chain
MNVSYHWLQALAPNLTDTPQVAAERLALLGAPVDEMVDLGAGIGDVVIARVDAVRQHPNADRLRICTVDAGGAEPLQVVCGAPNVEAGRFYPLAPVGSSLPGGIEIKKAKLRGEVSEGMLCSARELGLGRDHAGLMTLTGEWQPGERFLEALGLDDVRLVVDITPNRSEMLSHWGVARELAPGGEDDLVLAPFPGAAPGEVLEIVPAERAGETAGVPVRIEDVEGCPRYAAAVIRGVKVAPSPEWLASKLRAVGVRPINNVVDATNYVMLELGQPLHAFDLQRLAGPAIVVRRARSGEVLKTLDGVERTLDPEMLVIADAERAIALAGVMGGEESEVRDETTDLLIECARFDARRVRRAARGVGLSTDASYRYEREVDPELQPRALARVVELIVAVAGGEVAGSGVDVNPIPFQRQVVELRPERVERVLGIPVPAEEIASLLGAIGFRVQDTSARPLAVEVPGFRSDISREIDLIEEVARRRGYDSFPEALAPFRPSAVPEDAMVGVQRRLRQLLVGRGLLEARTAGFAPASEERVALLNPLSSEESHLRNTLTQGLLRRVEHNWARGTRDVRLFEIGSVFRPTPGARPHEEVRVAVVLTGATRPPHWSGPAPAWDVWDLKALLAELAEALGAGEVVPGEWQSLSGLVAPEEALVVEHGEARRGGGGRVSDAAVDAPAWAEPVWAAELVLAAPKRAERIYRALPEFPGSERDLALLVPDAVSAAELEATIRAAASELLEETFAFDRYAGKGIPEGTSSLAWRLRFRAPGRTLTDAEVDKAVGRVLNALEERHGVRRR